MLGRNGEKEAWWIDMGAWDEASSESGNAE